MLEQSLSTVLYVRKIFEVPPPIQIQSYIDILPENQFRFLEY